VVEIFLLRKNQHTLIDFYIFRKEPFCDRYHSTITSSIQFSIREYEKVFLIKIQGT